MSSDNEGFKLIGYMVCATSGKFAAQCSSTSFYCSLMAGKYSGLYDTMKKEAQHQNEDDKDKL